MSLARLVLRSLAYYWTTGVVVVFGLAVATAVITGSLVIGDSVTGSLRDTALSRLGSIDQALVARGHFREQLAADLMGEPAVSAAVECISPMLSSHGAARQPETQAVVPEVAVLGVDTEFWSFYDGAAPQLSGRECAVNAALARDLSLTEGDYLLMTTHRQSAISSDTLFARRGKQDTAPSMRLRVKSVLPGGGAGDFRLDAQSSTPRNVFISRQWLASRLDKPGLVNVLLSASKPQARKRAAEALTSALAGSCTLADHRLKLVANSQRNYLSLTSDATVLTAAQVRAARQAAEACHAQSGIASVYLANDIHKGYAPPLPSISYAMIAGLEPLAPFAFAAGGDTRPGEGEVWVNTWAARDLDADVGDELVLIYMIPTADGTYPTENIGLTVSAIVELAGPAADRGLVPDFEGITDAAHVGEWEPPFPVDLSRVTERDEQYWDKYRATPKAFVSLATVRAMWQSGPQGESADWVTSVRVVPPAGTGLAALHAAFTTALLHGIRPGQSGLAFRPVRELALEASRGTADFGQLFLGLSMFLVLSGVGLGGMLLRLSVDRRASEVGIMLAIGISLKLVGRALFAEGAILTVLGTLLGVPAGLLYAAGIISALGNWWSGAMGGVTSLWLHFTPTSLLIGAASGLVLGLLTVVWSTRRLGRLRVLELLAGQQALAVAPARPRQRLAAVSLVALLVIAAALGLLAVGSDALPSQAAFFAIGVALLLAALLAGHLILARAVRISPASRSLLRLALRNAAAGSSRSLLVIGLLAAASFVIVAVAANTRDYARMDVTRKYSGTGGFSLLATSSVPLSFSLSSPAGRANLGFSPEDEAAFEGVQVVSFLASPGEDISCLNIAKPTYPRVLGVGEAMIQRGGFSAIGRNGSLEVWASLNKPAEDGAIPALGDAASVQWTLHSGLGQTYEMPAADGEPVKLRFVGVLPDSIFQRELLVSEANFRRLFPTITSPSYFLIDTPPGREHQVAAVLRKHLGEMGLQVRTTREVLNDFMQVQNTYLAMFLALGSLGLLLGTIGLVTVLLRSALERRGELALMLATGFYRPRLARLLLIENGGLLLAGLACGTVSALVAVAPHLVSAEARVNWQVLISVLLGILLFGLVSCLIAVHSVVRGTVISALRQE